MARDHGSGQRALVIDDEPVVREVVGQLLAADGFAVENAADCASARICLAAGTYDLVLVDKNLPDGNGLDLARELLDESDDRVVLVMTGYGSLDSAITALRMRVSDFLVKPFDSIEEVSLRVGRAMEGLRLRREHRQSLLELQAQKAHLESLAIRDPLTGLYNHAYFQEGLTREISRSLRYQHEMGLLFVDVDNFKQVNDTLGHLAGDEVLKRIASILRGQSRDTDYHFRLREHDLAARYGGDEFVLLLPETSKSGAAVTAERLRLCAEETAFEPRSRVTLSIGVAAFPQDGSDRDGLIKAADLALYAAKHSGRNRVIAFTDTLASAGGEQTWETLIDVQRLAALQRLIAFAELPFVYQAVVRADDGQPIGFEALCRPQDPCLADAVTLLEVAERAGRTTELGRLLRRQAIVPIGWLAGDLALFVNLHPQELHDSKLLESSPKLLEHATRIVFEITRCGQIQDLKRLDRVLGELRAHGFRLALEDLPEGYQGIELINALRPDFVKLSAGELGAHLAEPRTRRILRHLIDCCIEEGIAVIADQIEVEADREAALELGIDLLQGRLLAAEQPCPAPDAA